MQLTKRGNWEAIKRIGEGGQGEVFFACDASEARLLLSDFRQNFLSTVPAMLHSLDQRQGNERHEAIALDSQLVAAMARAIVPLRLGALKVLKDETVAWV